MNDKDIFIVIANSKIKKIMFIFIIILYDHCYYQLQNLVYFSYVWTKPTFHFFHTVLTCINNASLIQCNFLIILIQSLPRYLILSLYQIIKDDLFN